MEGVGTQLQGVGESWEPCARRQHYRTKQNQQFIPSFHLVLTIPRTGQQGPIVAVVIWGQNHYYSERPPPSFPFHTGCAATWAGILLGLCPSSPQVPLHPPEE